MSFLVKHTDQHLLVASVSCLSIKTRATSRLSMALQCLRGAPVSLNSMSFEINHLEGLEEEVNPTG